MNKNEYKIFAKDSDNNVVAEKSVIANGNHWQSEVNRSCDELKQKTPNAKACEVYGKTGRLFIR